MPRKAKENKDVTPDVVSTKAKTTPKTQKRATKVNSEKEKKVNTTTKKSTKTPAAKKETIETTKKKTTTKNTKKKTTASTTKPKKVASKTVKKVSKKVVKQEDDSLITATAKPEDFSVIEYYDLPYRYNQTVVKVLAQTPTTLFIYWDIADSDRKNYCKEFGDNFFETTKPVLIIHNDTMQYSFEVEINDFANCWYLNVNDSKCNYRIELGRRPYTPTPVIPNNYVYVSSSNVIESPNDHILINKEQQMLYFKNVKTNTIKSIPPTTLSFIRNMGKIYNIYDIYKKIYKEEQIEDIYDLSNPSSQNPSSQFK